MLEGLRRRLDSKDDSTAVWAAFWLAVVLIAAKAFYLAREAADPPSDALSFCAALAAISYSDLIYAAIVGFFHRLALAGLHPADFEEFLASLTPVSSALHNTRSGLDRLSAQKRELLLRRLRAGQKASPEG